MGFEWFSLYVPFNQTTIGTGEDDDTGVRLHAEQKRQDVAHYFKDVSVTLVSKEISAIVGLTAQKLKTGRPHAKHKPVLKLNRLSNFFHGGGK